MKRDALQWSRVLLYVGLMALGGILESLNHAGLWFNVVVMAAAFLAACLVDGR